MRLINVKAVMVPSGLMACLPAGEVISEKDRCKKCEGKKVVKEVKILEVHVDKGMKHGQKITFGGEADQAPAVEPGDIVLVLQEKEHEVIILCFWVTPVVNQSIELLVFVGVLAIGNTVHINIVDWIFHRSFAVPVINTVIAIP